MTLTASPPRHARNTTPTTTAAGDRPGPLGRLGVWVTNHTRLTTVVWLLAIIVLGAFAPRVEAELSGAGWQADGPVTEGAGAQILADATKMLVADSRIADVVAPQPGATISPGRAAW